MVREYITLLILSLLLCCRARASEEQSAVALQALQTSHDIGATFAPFIEAFTYGVTNSQAYAPPPYVWSLQDLRKVTGVTAVVVAEVTNVQLMAITASSRTLSEVRLWYIARATVREVRTGQFGAKGLAFLFNERTAPEGYGTPYLPGLMYAFHLRGDMIAAQEHVSVFKPHSASEVRDWGAFCREHRDDANWLVSTVFPAIRTAGAIANVHFEIGGSFVVITTAKQSLWFSQGMIANCGDVERTIVSLATRAVVDEAAFRVWQPRAQSPQ